MNNKNIIFNYTLDQYNKKYRNRRHRLLKHTKKQVEDFDKQYGHYIYNNKTYSLDFKHYLLKDRKWTLIGDTYYEIPKPIRFTWFRNLSLGIQAITCLVGAGVVSTAIAVPTVLLNNTHIQKEEKKDVIKKETFVKSLKDFANTYDTSVTAGLKYKLEDLVIKDDFYIFSSTQGVFNKDTSDPSGVRFVKNPTQSTIKHFVVTFTNKDTSTKSVSLSLDANSPIYLDKAEEKFKSEGTTGVTYTVNDNYIEYIDLDKTGSTTHCTHLKVNKNGFIEEYETYKAGNNIEKLSLTYKGEPHN